MKQCTQCDTKSDVKVEHEVPIVPITIVKNCKYCGAMNKIELATIPTKIGQNQSLKPLNYTGNQSTSVPSLTDTTSDRSRRFLDAYEKNLLIDENSIDRNEYFDNWYIKNNDKLDKIIVQEYSESFKDIHSPTIQPEAVFIEVPNVCHFLLIL